MGQPAAKQGDQIAAIDYHNVIIQQAPVLLPHPFTGIIDGALSPDVMIMGLPAATVDSTASNLPAHIPQGGPFQKPPSNKAKVIMGSVTVKINGKMVARHGDTANTCNDPADFPAGKIIAAGTVLIGG